MRRHITAVLLGALLLGALACGARCEELYAWGDNQRGCLGLGDTTRRLVPTRVGTDSNWRCVATGQACSAALKSDGTLWAWGFNCFGQLGLGDTTDRHVPVQVGTDTDWASLSGTRDHFLALKTDGTLWAWGNNEYGQLGLGDTINRPAPVQVGTDSDWTAIAAGMMSSAALKADGTLWLWPGVTPDNSVPLQLGTDSDWVSVSLCSTLLAIKSNGTLWGMGGWWPSATLTQAAGTDTDWWKASSGNWTHLMIKRDGTLWTFYSSISGSTLTRFGTDSDWVEASPNWEQSAALKSDGSLWWGYLPTETAPGTRWAAVSTGMFHYLAIRAAPLPTRIWVVPVSGTAGETVTLQGVLLDSQNNRLTGKVLHFSVDGSEVGTGATAAYGYATCPFAIPAGWAGAHTVTAAFADAGDPAYLTSSRTGTLTITADRATSIWAPATSGALGDTVKLQGCLYAANGGQKLPGQTLVFKVGGVTVGTGTTDVYGYALCPYAITSGTPGGSIGFTVEFAGVTGLAASSGSSTVTILMLRQTSLWVVPVTAAGGTRTYLQACLYASKGYDRLIGKVLHFSLDGVPVGDATTAAWGYAALPITVPAGSGPLAIEVTYDGDGTTFTGATGHGTLTRP